tara:strand:- start:56 stop:820 length:765 start_codon:yes stop_codon:yes gene_type:complete
MWPHFAIEIGNTQGQIPLYGLMLGCGLITLFLGVDFAARRQGRDPEIIGRFHYCLLTAFLSGLASALLLTKLIHGADTPWGKMAAMPGILGGTAGLIAATRCWRVPLTDWLPLALPFLCLTHAWGRLGCFLAGCCYGKPTENALGVQFPEDSMACAAHGHVPVHPTQLYELALLVGLAAALHFAIPTAQRFWSYLLIYGTGRFAIEFLRGDDRGSIHLIAGLSPSQQLCLLFIAAGTGLAGRQWRQRQAASPRT